MSSARSADDAEMGMAALGPRRGRDAAATGRAVMESIKCAGPYSWQVLHSLTSNAVAALACLLCRVLDGVVGMHAVTAAAVDGRMILVLGQGVGVHYRAVGVGEDGAGFKSWRPGLALLAAVATAAEAGRVDIDGGVFQPFRRLRRRTARHRGRWPRLSMSLWQVVHSCVAWFRCGHRRVAERVALGAVAGGASRHLRRTRSPLSLRRSRRLRPCEPAARFSLRSAVFGAQPTVPRDMSAMTPATAEARTILRRDT